MSVEPRLIATAPDYDGLCAGLRARFADIEMTYGDFEQIFGFAQGHVGKVLGDAQIKKIGPMTLNGFLEYLALDIVLVENPERRILMEPLWQKRARPNFNAVRTASVGKVTIKRMFPVIAREMQKLSRDAIPAETRSRTARKAATARWKWQRMKRRQRKKDPT